MATKHNDTCRQRAADDEPIFTLRAKDRVAPEVVECWIAAVLAAYHESRVTPTPQVIEKLREAQACADKMLDWQRGHGSKLPD